MKMFGIGDPVNVVLASIEEWNRFENTSVEARSFAARVPGGGVLLQ